MSPRTCQSARLGLTVAELVIVLLVLTVLGSVLLPALGQWGESSRETATRASLVEIRNALVDHYFHDQFESLPEPLDVSRVAHPQLAYLFVNPATEDETRLYNPQTARGWKGPYLQIAATGRYETNDARNFTRRYGETGDPAPLDGWGAPIVVQVPDPDSNGSDATERRFARLVSAGPDGVLNTPPDVLQPTALQTSDDLVLYLWISR